MKKKLVAMALVVCLLAVAVIGGTLAYFTDTDDNKNTFTVGDVDINLDEAYVVFDDVKDEYVKETKAGGALADRVTENTYSDIFPGATLPKDPTIHNIGSYAAYVYATVEVDNLLLKALGCNLDTKNFDNFKKYVTGGVMDGEGGTKYSASLATANGIADGIADTNVLFAAPSVGTSTTTFTIYWLNPLAAGSSVTIFEQIKIDSSWDNATFEDLQGVSALIEINAYAIQAKGFVDGANAATVGSEKAEAKAFAALSSQGATEHVETTAAN